MRTAAWKIFFIFSALVFAIYADNIIREISAVPQSNSVKITFETENETGVASFIFQRSVGNLDNFEDIHQVDAAGHPGSYSYLDEFVWFKKVTTSVIYYRIAIVMTGNEISYSDPVMVMPNVSEIVKTWGSIKLLFR